MYESIMYITEIQSYTGCICSDATCGLSAAKLVSYYCDLYQSLYNSSHMTLYRFIPDIPSCSCVLSFT